METFEGTSYNLNKLQSWVREIYLIRMLPATPLQESNGKLAYSEGSNLIDNRTYHYPHLTQIGIAAFVKRKRIKKNKFNERQSGKGDLLPLLMLLLLTYYTNEGNLRN